MLHFFKQNKLKVKTLMLFFVLNFYSTLSSNIDRQYFYSTLLVVTIKSPMYSITTKAIQCSLDAFLTQSTSHHLQDSHVYNDISNNCQMVQYCFKQLLNGTILFQTIAKWYNIISNNCQMVHYFKQLSNSTTLFQTIVTWYNIISNNCQMVQFYFKQLFLKMKCCT
jgi:hypothetical protein